MAFEHKPGSFTFFKNHQKKSEKSADYWGDGVALDGTPIKVSAWIREGSKGKFLSCVMERKGEQPQRESKPKPSQPAPQQRALGPNDAPF